MERDEVGRRRGRPRERRSREGQCFPAGRVGSEPGDEELELLTEKPTLAQACREVLSWGPTAVVAKLGKYGAVLVTESGHFALPAFPLEQVVDPTGAGDTFAGGFVGFVAAHPDE